jgi:hypothetical protein
VDSLLKIMQDEAMFIPDPLVITVTGRTSPAYSYRQFKFEAKRFLWVQVISTPTEKTNEKN